MAYLLLTVSKRSMSYVDMTFPYISAHTVTGDVCTFYVCVHKPWCIVQW